MTTAGRSFGAVLRSYRAEVGLTQEELAERAGLSRRGIADLERGARLAPHVQTVERLAAALGISDVERSALIAAGRAHPAGRARLADGPPSDVPARAANNFVGRAVELERLRAACDRALGGHGVSVLVDGEPGIGKTALCVELATYARSRGIRTLIRRCYEEPGLSAPIAQFALTDQLLSEPSVIVVEDLQWADGPTLEAFRHLARELDAAQLLLVGTYRDAEINHNQTLSRMVDELSRRPEFVRISLRGLSSGEVLRFATDYTARKVTEAAAEALREQTEGNPLFIKEITRFLIDHDLELTGPDVVADVLLKGLQDVIRRSLASLSGDCKEYLSIASVMGREFETEIVAEVADFDDQQVRMALQEAQRARIVEDIGGPRGARFRFVHVLFCLTLCEELFVPRRLEIQRRAAYACQRREVRSRAERAAELSEQFVNPGAPAGSDVLSLNVHVRQHR